MSELENAFNQLLSFDMWEDVAVTLAAFFAPTVVQNLVGGVVPNSVDVPEAYGLAVVAGSRFSPMYKREIAIGGGLYTADAVADRFGIKSTIVNMGA